MTKKGFSVKKKQKNIITDLRNSRQYSPRESKATFHLVRNEKFPTFCNVFHPRLQGAVSLHRRGRYMGLHGNLGSE